MCFSLKAADCYVCFSAVQFQLNKDKMNFSTLRNIQGLHAPLKLQMEYRAARQVAAFHISDSPTAAISLHFYCLPLSYSSESSCLVSVFSL